MKDLRSDRQPEFTQIDVEMSFVTVEEDIRKITEGLMVHIFKEVLGIGLETPFPVLPYKEAMSRYGLDKPDIRFGMELRDITDELRNSSFEVFKGTLDGGGIIKAINVKGGGTFSRKEIEDLTHFVYNFGAKGLLSAKISKTAWQSPIQKFITEEERRRIEEKMEAQEGDLLLLMAGSPKVVNQALANLRLHLGQKLGLIPEDQYRFLWIVDFPLLEFDETEKRTLPSIIPLPHQG